MTQGERITFNQQVGNLETTLSQLKTGMDDRNLSQYLAKSLTIVTHGSNDYLNNYLMPELYPSSYIYDPKSYADLLIQRYKNQILVNFQIHILAKMQGDITETIKIVSRRSFTFTCSSKV